jgi:hypothetical protein
MKHPKWLLIGVLILLIINVLFYSVWYAFDVQGKVNKRLEAYLSKTLKGTLSIQKLSINDRHITANNIKYISSAKDIQFQIKQVQIRYNLLRIIVSGFNINKAINQISVYEPRATLIVQIKDSKPVKIPDLVPYFKALEIENGSLNITFSTQIGKDKATNLLIRENLKNINLAINNRKSSDVKLKAVTANGGSVDLTTNLDKGSFTKAKLQLSQFKPSLVQISGFSNVSSEISMLINYIKPKDKTNPDIEVNSILWNTNFTYDKYSVLFPYLHFSGNLSRLAYDLRGCEVNKNVFSSQGVVTNPLNKLSFKSGIDFSRIALSEIDQDMIGTASGQVKLSGNLENIKATGNFSLPAVSYQTEEIKDLTLAAKYASDSLSFSTNEFNWRNQASRVDGYFNIKTNRLGLNVKTNPMDNNQNLKLESDLAALVDFNKEGIKADIEVRNLNISNLSAEVTGLTGNAKIASDTSISKSVLVDIALDNSQGLSLSLSGDLTMLKLKSVVSLDSILTYNYSPYLKSQGIDSSVSGKIYTELDGKEVTGNCRLALDMASPKLLRTSLVSDFNYQIGSNTGNLSFATDAGYLNNSPISLKFNSTLENKYFRLTDFNLDNAVFADGWVNLQNMKEFGAKVIADSVDFGNYWKKLSLGDIEPPLSSKISLELDYNYNHDSIVSGYIKADSCSIPAIKPINSYITIRGTTAKIELFTDIVTSENSKLSLQSTVSLSPELKFVINGQLSSFKLQDILTFKKSRGTLNGTVQWAVQSKKNKSYDSTFSVDVMGNGILYQGFPVDSLQVKITQLNDLLSVEHLHLLAGDYFNLTGKGSLDYNILTNSYENGNHYLNLAFEGDVLKWLNKHYKYIEQGKGKVKCQVVVKANEDGLIIENGFLTLAQGMVKLKDQVETIKSIDLQSRITNNQFKLDKFSCQMGEGKLFIRNEIDPSGDNFNIGPLNLGYFLLRTDDNGIKVTIPDYMPPNSTATAVLKGQGRAEATIKGPFDDMEIKGEILCSNGSALYPASTNNLMSLMNFFRTESKQAETPLPMTLDLMIIIKDNVHYVTYPANLRCLPESFLHLTYDGNMWNASEAEFQSEQGTLDFYGSIFDVEFVKLVINLQQQITALNGTFIRKAPDGTLVTLSVTTNLQKTGDLFNQLEFTLTSDNPDDRTPIQILSRLRYNRNMDELTPEQQQSLLQDEAMQVIGTSVSTTYISQWLSPVENSIRKFLRLDNFSITTGFIQNLYLQYRTKSSESASFSNPNNLNSDIMQFSSSVLLNNLSLSMGKYLGKGMFLDYQVQMQETTDLAKKTKLVFYHNTSLRYNLPWKLRLSYTYSIKPLRESNSHEIMIQRSFRF